MQTHHKASKIHGQTFELLVSRSVCKYMGRSDRYNKGIPAPNFSLDTCPFKVQTEH